MLCAPVIIPTLNRIEHLKRCIESLKNNSYAKDTELYIGLDYPPSERYEEGYVKVKDYLEQGIVGFKKVHVFMHSQNLGPLNNEEFLINKISGNYSAYIFTEDDNEFSPCFLEYMNKCLELFEYDDEVIAVCGSAPKLLGTKIGLGVYKAKYYSGYGTGFWVEKEKNIRKTVHRTYIENLCCNPYKLKEIRNNNTYAFRALCSLLLRKELVYSSLDGRIPIIDATRQIYALADNKYSIFSEKKMVKNWGYDGSGVHCVKELSEISTRMITNDAVYGDIGNVLKYEGRLVAAPNFKELCLILSAQFRIAVWRIIAKRKMIK